MVLAPVACSEDNPITDGAFSCDFAKRYSPCYQDFESEACVLFRDDSSNPCLRRPDGPACLKHLGTPPEGCTYPPPENATLTPECSAYVAALIDQCQTRPSSCPGPFGGSQEQLTLVKASDDERQNGGETGGRNGTEELPLELAESGAGAELAGGSSADSTPAPTVSMPSTGLDLAAIVWSGLALLGAGLLIRAGLSGPTPASRPEPAVMRAAAPVPPVSPGSRPVVWTGLTLLASGVLIRLVAGHARARTRRH